MCRRRKENGVKLARMPPLGDKIKKAIAQPLPVGENDKRLPDRQKRRKLSIIR